MELPVPVPPNFDEDFRFAERCLLGDGNAIADLRKNHLDLVLSYIVRAGASGIEGVEIVEALLTDCLIGTDGVRPVLAAYLGQCPLRGWLCRVALNRLISRKRAVRRDHSVFNTESRDEELDTVASSGGELSEEPVLRLVRDAIVRAFTECDPEQFVILQLLHADELKEAEVARIFGYSISKVSRQAERAREALRKAMVDHVRASDPWLELTFDDLLGICRTVLPDCFGLE